MKKITTLTILMLFLFVSCEEKVEVTELDFSDNVVLSGADKTQSVNAFKKSVYPIVKKNCASCHGDGGDKVGFAVSDVEKAHDLLLASGKVNLNLASQSRLYLRLSKDNHNCWSNCNDNAEEMLVGIKDWLKNIYVENSGVKTESKDFKSGVERYAETIRGSVVLEAEDAIKINPTDNNGNVDNDFLQGRYLVNHLAGDNVDSGASALRYITGDFATPHPEGNTGRVISHSVGSAAQGCRLIENGTDINRDTGGRIRYAETKRHPGVTGYRPYATRLKFNIIRPDKRNEYQTAINSQGANVNTTYVTTNEFLVPSGGPIYENGNLKGYDGGPIGSGNTVIVLPDFLLRSEFLSQVFNDRSTNYSKNYFTRRYGNPAVNLFSPQNMDVRNNIPEELRDSILADIKSRMRSIFFDGSNPRNISSIPAFFHKMTIGGNVVSYTRDADIANDFANELMSGMTKSNLQNYVHFFSTNADYIYYANIDYDGAVSDINLNELYQAGTNFELDVSNLFASTDVDYRKIAVKNFQTTLHKTLRANCTSCHSGQAAGRPDHAHDNIETAYNDVVSLVNLEDPQSSRIYQRMKIDRHNCGGATSCDNIAAEMVTEITKWNTQTAAEYAVALANPKVEYVNLSQNERAPGRARLPFIVKDAGDYSLWTKTKAADAGKDSFYIRLLDDKNRPVKRCRKDNKSCAPASDSDYTNKSALEIDDMHCIDWNVAENGMWNWETQSYTKPEERMIWRINPGKYTIEIIEKEVGAKLDMIAFSKEDTFDPKANLQDEAAVQAIRPKVLEYDLSKILNSPGKFTIEVEEFNGDSYRFRNPRIIGNTHNVAVSSIKVTISDVYSQTNATYNELEIVTGTDGETLTPAVLIAQQINGADADYFSFSFELIKSTDAAVSFMPKEELTANNNRECKHLDLFEKTIFPILSEFKLIYKNDTNGSYRNLRIPGTARRASTGAQFFNCTTCHNEDHPYFKMTTFFNRDANGNIDKASLQKLCSQALSRVKYDSPSTSLLLRGFEGKSNHLELHFAQYVKPVGSNGNYTSFEKDSTSADGYKSTWKGLRFETYTESDLNINSFSGSDKAYLQKFIGQYKFIRYNTINDEFAYDQNGRSINGQTAVEGDSYSVVDGYKIYNSPNGKTNKFYVFNPINELPKGTKFNPATITKTGNSNTIIKIKDGCSVNFKVEDGRDLDPCNGNVDAHAEFEAVKSEYRKVILNWMNKEIQSAK